MKTVIVIGGGWAGVSAAHELNKKGWKVTLIERAKMLGGRAGSSMNPKLGFEVDCGQHLFLGAYEQSLKLLKSLGTVDGVRIGKTLEVDYFSSHGLVNFKAWPVPGPLSLAGALINFKLLTGAEKREALLLGLRGWRGILNPSSLKRLTAQAWLKRCGQSEGLIRKFWEPLCLGALNAPTDKGQAELLAVALKRGFLKGGSTAALGVPLKPLSQFLPVDVLKGQGIEVRLGLGSTSVSSDGKTCKVTLENDEVLESDAVVLALPALLAAKQCDLNLKEAASIEGSPILTAHIFTENVILPSAFGVLAPEDGDLGFEFHWAFDRTRLCGDRGKAGEVWNCFLASAARRMAGMSQEAILTELKRQLSKRLPDFDPSKITQAIVLKEARATPLFGPGDSRPSQKTKYKNLLLAGDWTDTALPATIEGAVVSGILAANFLS